VILCTWIDEPNVFGSSVEDWERYLERMKALSEDDVPERELAIRHAEEIIEWKRKLANGAR
jgi:hypothetical protein